MCLGLKSIGHIDMVLFFDRLITRIHFFGLLIQCQYVHITLTVIFLLLKKQQVQIDSN